MAFEIGDKVLTSAGLYISGEWRERGLKGKVVDISQEYGGLITVKFKGIEELRFLRPEYLILRNKKKEEKVPEVERPFEVGDVLELQADVFSENGGMVEGCTGEVLEVIPNSNLVYVDFGIDELTLSEDLLAFPEEQESPDFELDAAVPDLHDVKDNPEVQDALALILERIEEIKALLTTQPKSEVHFTIHPSNGLTEEEVAEALQKEEEPAPEPVFKKAKEIKLGDLLYTEAGVWDKVDRIDTKASGYTSLYGVFGNKIAQVPSGRVVQVLEEVS